MEESNKKLAETYVSIAGAEADLIVHWAMNDVEDHKDIQFEAHFMA